MIRLGAPLFAGIMLAAALEPSPVRAQVPADAPASPSSPESPPESSPPPKRSASAWLKAGESHQQKGEYVQAAEAFLAVFESLSPRKQSANEGARAAMLAADAYWLAFEDSLESGHLQAALDVLERWRSQADPKSTLRRNVERASTEIHAVLDPLQSAEAQLSAGGVAAAAGGYETALEALDAQNRPWSCGARLALEITGAQVAAYDEGVAASEDLSEGEALLLSARATLETWGTKRPADGAPELGEAIDERRGEVQRRLDAIEQQRAAAALRQQEQAAARRAEQQAAAEQAAVEDAERRLAAEREAEARRAGRRTTATILLSAGAVATAAGAGLMGEGIAFTGVSREQADAARGRADELDTTSAGYDRAGFDADLAAYRDSARRRSVAFLASGSVLLGVGLATGIWGAVWLAKSGSKRGGGGRRARLTPTGSRAHLGLQLTGSF